MLPLTLPAVGEVMETAGGVRSGDKETLTVALAETLPELLVAVSV